MILWSFIFLYFLYGFGTSVVHFCICCARCDPRWRGQATLIFSVYVCFYFNLTTMTMIWLYRVLVKVWYVNSGENRYLGDTHKSEETAVSSALYKKE